MEPYQVLWACPILAAAKIAKIALYWQLHKGKVEEWVSPFLNMVVLSFLWSSRGFLGGPRGPVRKTQFMDGNR